MDIVKPIPASIPTEERLPQEISFGFSIRFNFVPIDVDNIIPNGFPITNPSIIPSDTASEPFGNSFILRVIAVLDNANKGNII